MSLREEGSAEGRAIRPALPGPDALEVIASGEGPQHARNQYVRGLAALLLTDGDKNKAAGRFGIPRNSLIHPGLLLKRMPRLAPDVLSGKVPPGRAKELTIRHWDGIMNSKPEKEKSHAKKVTDAATRQQLPEMSGFQDDHAESLYRAMLSAPEGAVTVPLINRASKVVELISDLEEIEPEIAATMMPAVRVREYSGTLDLAEWWYRFAMACDKRRQEEIPQLGHRRRTSRAKWRVKGGEPEIIHELGPIAHAALTWLTEHGAATLPQIAVAIQHPGTERRLRDLVQAELVRPVGQDGSLTVYEAVISAKKT